jgi:hypothetical protein
VNVGYDQKENKEKPWRMVYLGGTVMARVESWQWRENESAALWHPVIKTRRVSEYDRIK